MTAEREPGQLHPEDRLELPPWTLIRTDKAGWPARVRHRDSSREIIINATDDVADDNLFAAQLAEALRRGSLALEAIETLRHMVRWHDQLSPKDIERAKAILAEADGRGRNGETAPASKQIIDFSVLPSGWTARIEPVKDGGGQHQATVTPGDPLKEVVAPGETPQQALEAAIWAAETVTGATRIA